MKSPTPRKKTKAAQSSEGAGTESIPSDVFVEWLIDRMKDGSPVERRVPKILKDRFNSAVFRYWEMGTADELMELRARDASNLRKCISVWGIHNTDAHVPNLDLRPFPPGYQEAAKALRDVCDELSHYLNGGAADYCAAPVVDSVTPHLNSKKSSVRGKAIRKKDDYNEAKKLWDAWQKPPHNAAEFRFDFARILIDAVCNQVNMLQLHRSNGAIPRTR